MPQDLPYSAASERNRDPILAVLREVFTVPQSLLEIGSGTGQHAVYFAEQLPHLQWIPSETPQRQATLAPRLALARLPNLQPTLQLDVTSESWPVDNVQGVFAANVAHIMSWDAVGAMFAGMGRILASGGAFCLYGPFNTNGQFTSDSNATFDTDLRTRDAAMGIRDLADLQALAKRHALTLEQDFPMPANNRLLVWRRT